nr:CoA transferase [Bradyrhizobium betae]
MTGVFQGLKVIDSATFVAGPAAAVILADFGADVVKVEPVGAGDPQRVLGRLPNLPKADYNYAWTIASRSKRALALDLKNEASRTILAQLVSSADVFITNQSPASRTRLGISYEQLSRVNPRLVYAALTGYGETGPEAERPGFDAHAYWARSGLATTCGLMERVLLHRLLWEWAISRRPSRSTPASSPRFYTGSEPGEAVASRPHCSPTERGRTRRRFRLSCAVAKSSTACRGRRPGTL